MSRFLREESQLSLLKTYVFGQIFAMILIAIILVNSTAVSHFETIPRNMWPRFFSEYLSKVAEKIRLKICFCSRSAWKIMGEDFCLKIDFSNCFCYQNGQPRLYRNLSNRNCFIPSEAKFQRHRCMCFSPIGNTIRCFPSCVAHTCILSENKFGCYYEDPIMTSNFLKLSPKSSVVMLLHRNFTSCPRGVCCSRS